MDGQDEGAVQPQELPPELQDQSQVETQEAPAEPQEFRQPVSDEASFFRQEAQRNSERAVQLEREIAALRQQQQSYQQQQYDQRAEQEYLQQLDPDQRYAYLRQMDQQRADQRFLASQIQTHDTLDKMRFDQYLDRNPEHARLAGEVEVVYKQILDLATRAGYPVQATRERALAQVLFEKNKAEGPRARRTAEREASQTRQRQTTRPASMASTVSRQSSSRQEESAYDAAIRRLVEAGQVE